MWLWVSITKFKTIKKFICNDFVCKNLKSFREQRQLFAELMKVFQKLKQLFAELKNVLKVQWRFFVDMTLQVFYYRGTNIFCCVLSGTESNFFPQKQNPIFGGKRMKTIPFISGLTSFGQNYFLFDFLIVTKMSPK